MGARGKPIAPHPILAPGKRGRQSVRQTGGESMPHCKFVNLSLTDLQGDKIDEHGFYDWL